MKNNKISSILDLFLTFFKIGAITFGGGYSMLPIIQREVVDKKKWITDEELINFFAISQSTPGVISVNIATYIGYKRERLIGSVFSTIGVITPSIIVITIVASLLNNFNEYTIVKSALKGINISVSVLLIFSIISISKKAIEDKLGYFIAFLSLISVLIFKMDSIYIIIISAFIGIFLHYKKVREKNI